MRSGGSPFGRTKIRGTLMRSGGSPFGRTKIRGTLSGARNLGAPGPEAGAGLTSLALAGAYALMRRRRTVGKAASRR
jgi:hypothetical protein